MQKSDAELATEKDVIKTEIVLGANTANRIGTMVEDLNDSKINNDRKTDAIGTSSVLVASQKNVNDRLTEAKAYADGLVVGLWDDRGNYNPTGTSTYPATGGSGAAGAIKKGDIWTVSVAGTIAGITVQIGDTVRALVDTPGLTAGNWTIAETNIGYVPVNVADRTDAIGTSSVLVASQKNVNDRLTEAKAYADGLVVGLWDDRGNYNPTGTSTYPATGGSGAAGAIKKGDIWTVSAAGTIDGFTVQIGDTVRALIDTPGLTAGNWNIAELNIGYIPVNAADKSDQTNAETSSDATLGNRNDTKWFTARSWRWAWDKMLTLATVFTSSLKAKQIAGDYGVLTDAATIAWNANTIGNSAQITLITTGRTIGAITNPLTGAIYILRAVQDATGGRTLAFNAAFTFPNGITPVLNSLANAVTVYAFFYDGTNFRYILPNGAQRVLDLFIENQKAAAGMYRGLIIDDTGKVLKEINITYDPVTKKMTLKGANTLNTGYTLVIVDSNDSIMAQFRNDKCLELFGTSATLEVNDGIESGNASIRFLTFATGTGLGFRFQDKSFNDYLNFRSLTTDRGLVARQPMEFDYGLSEKRLTRQYTVTTDTTAAAQTVVFEFTLADLDHYDIKVLHSDATATDSASITSLGVDCADVRKVAATNIEGNTSISTQSRLPSSITTGAFNWNLDTTNQKIQYRFQNITGTGKTFVVWVEITLVKRITPIVD